MNLKYYLFCFLACVGVSAIAQKTSGEIYEDLRKLKVMGSVLYIAAHPDDENTRLITWLSRERHYRTGYLSMTRGDGGQNLIGEEQGVDLGLIRTQELLAARRIDGAYQFFTRALDFGYSKTPEETFQKWGHDQILADVVWVIRSFKPDILITRFPTTGEGGHGHHTASAILANEAFKAAADPKRFPEQLKYVTVWQPKRILFNHFNFGNTQLPAEAFKLDVGGYNPVLGKSYGEIASTSRSQHKSQGFGSALSRGESFEAFRLTGGADINEDIMSGINTSWSRAAGEKFEKRIDEIIKEFSFSKPENSVASLLALHEDLGKWEQGGDWAKWKREDLKDIIIQCSGLFMEAVTSAPYAVQGDTVQVQLNLNNRLGVPLELRSGAISIKPEKNKNNNNTIRIPLEANAPVSQPYWLQYPWMEGRYDVRDQQLIGKAENDAALQVPVTISFMGRPAISYSLPVRYKSVDQVKGELYQPFRVFPATSVEPQHNVNVVINAKVEDHLRVLALGTTATQPVYQNNLAVNSIPAMTRGQLTQLTQPSVKAADSITVNYNRQPSREPYLSLHQIKYDHIPDISYFTPARTKWVFPDVRIAGRQVGYIMGAGDKVPEALEQMGYQVTILGEKELENLDLDRFDAIISGIRAFNTNAWMDRIYPRLMDYVEKGGNYVVQYSQSNNIKSRIGPYPLTLSNRRITDENAEVKFLQPQHPVLNWPNKIDQKDFMGWVQERSIYHGSTTDPHYQAILAMHDPGESEDNGALLTAPYGKGFFTYTGLVLFRQLPLGVPGAYRLLANIIALNRKQEF